jgi:hypothetical protein
MQNLILSRALSFCISLLFFSFLSKEIRFWDTTGSIISSSFASTAIFVIPTIVLLLVLIFIRNKTIAFRQLFDPIGFSYSLVIYTLSDLFTRGFNLFPGPSIRGEIFCLALLLIFILPKISTRAFKLLSASAAIFLYCLFLFLSKHAPIISDDHSSFIFRLSLLRDYFPNIPFYYPGWNAGLDARDFFATGAIGYFLLTFPLHYILDISLSHNLALSGVIFIILPSSIFFSARLLSLSQITACIAALLSLCTTLVWYRWALKYGTVGFITSASLMPLVFTLGYKLISSGKLSRSQLALFIILGSISVMWPLGAFCYLALLIYALFRINKLILNKQLWLAALFLILINLPWATIFWKVSNVSKFIQKPSSTSAVETVYRHKHKGLDFSNSLKVLRETANSANPLIIFMAVPGIFLLPQGIRLIFGLQSLLFLIGGTVLVALKPQLELDRLLVFLGIFLSIPVAQNLSTLLRNFAQAKLLTALSFSYLFLSPFIVSNILHNRSAENFSFAGDLTQNLSSFIQSTPSQGRFLFSGFVLHELDGGHLAPLPYWTDKPIVASSPFHNRWQYTSVFPESFASRREQGIEEFLNLYNAEIVFAHEAIWRKYFNQQPERFELIWTNYPFIAYKRRQFISNYFVEGSGQILNHSKNELVLTVSSSDNIIKFNYFDFLTSSNCELSPVDYGLEFPFIKLKNCDINKPVIIKSISAIERVLK